MKALTPAAAVLLQSSGGGGITDTLVPLAVWLIAIVVVLGALAILGFGLRSVVQGKTEPITIGVMAVPVVIFVVLFLLMSPAQAAMYTVIVMFVLGLLALFSSGLWGLFT